MAVMVVVVGKVRRGQCRIRGCGGLIFVVFRLVRSNWSCAATVPGLVGLAAAGGDEGFGVWDGEEGGDPGDGGEVVQVGHCDYVHSSVSKECNPFSNSRRLRMTSFA